MGDTFAIEVEGTPMKGKGKQVERVIEKIYYDEGLTGNFMENDYSVGKEDFTLTGVFSSGYVYLNQLTANIVDKLDGLVENVNIYLWFKGQPQETERYEVSKNKKLRKVV